MSIRSAFLWTFLLFLLGGQSVARAQFVAADFQFETSANSTFLPGDVVVFNGKLTNLSSSIAVFGENIAIAGTSYDYSIGGVTAPASPYFEGVEASFFPNQSIAPGQSVMFPFLSVDTTSTIPLGVVVSLDNGNFLFQNIPPSTPDPFVDFFIPYLTASNSVSVPEPSTMLLALAAGSASALFVGLRRRLKHTRLTAMLPSTILRTMPGLVSSSVETTRLPMRMRWPAGSQHDRHSCGMPSPSTETLRPRHAIHFLAMMNLSLATIVDAAPSPVPLTTISTTGAKTSSGTTGESAKYFAEKPAKLF